MNSEDLKRLAEMIERIRRGALQRHDDTNCLAPQAEQFFLLALAALDSAAHHAMLAHYNNLRRD